MSVRIARERERCNAKSKQTGRRCGNPTIPGGTVCRYHGVNAGVIAAAAKRIAEEEVARFGSLLDMARFVTGQDEIDAVVTAIFEAQIEAGCDPLDIEVGRRAGLSAWGGVLRHRDPARGLRQAGRAQIARGVVDRLAAADSEAVDQHETAGLPTSPPPPHAADDPIKAEWDSLPDEVKARRPDLLSTHRARRSR